MARPLTAEMKKFLRAIVRGKSLPVKRATLTGLTARGLADASGGLTHNGWKHGVVMLSLQVQCALLGIEYEQVHGIDHKDHPEFAAWRYFCGRGYSGGYCEGGPILLLIRAAALDLFAQLNTFKSRQDACTRFTEAQLTIHQESRELILNAVRSADVELIVRGFNEIYSFLTVQEWYPGLTPETMASLFKTLGAERLTQITAAIIEAPYAYRAGWPDLIMCRSSEMMWAEVKTTDRLHMSQITTIHRMKPLLPGSVRVVHLVGR